jgi:chemotaxis protein histidine kinase CheA/ActR/RegA family two-component response regulator
MDMLAELVMLRNQRESRVDQLREINEELGRCGSRLRELESHFATLKHFVADEISHSNPLLEVANDIGEIGRTIRDSFEPVAAENIAVSSFIWQFREALVSLLRMPVTGLFQRLQRASLDAARVEGKQVRFVLKGAESGLERSLQERLFEPLLHIVRNAVSHGIETPRDRVRAGKDSVGTVTLEASNTPEMLVLTVRDDGRGLDYEALRIRGVEMKILAPDQPVCPKELARLIFHSGFSTRKAANEVAGRGIGMDVVASVLERMQSLVEVESTPGQGTTVRMSVPLRSNIEYAMVFRSADQLLAVPMPYVKNAGTQKPVSENKPRTIRRSLRGLLGQSIGGLEAAESSSISFNSQPKMTSGNRPDGAGSTSDTQSVHDCIELVVDEIIGPEEVVVRPLPPLLRHQQLFAGVTLSGGGHVVLVLDPTRLVSFSKIAYSTNSGRVTTAREKKGAILVVDDSLSSRRHMASMLQRRGWKTVEASDGISALDRLVPNAFDAVFTDFEMPRMDGLQLIHSIRTQTRFSDLPIVMISSLTPMAMREKAMKEGANYYVQKPASGDALEDILDRLVTYRSKPNE